MGRGSWIAVTSWKRDSGDSWKRQQAPVVLKWHKLGEDGSWEDFLRIWQNLAFTRKAWEVTHHRLYKSMHTLGEQVVLLPKTTRSAPRNSLGTIMWSHHTNKKWSWPTKYQFISKDCNPICSFPSFLVLRQGSDLFITSTIKTIKDGKWHCQIALATYCKLAVE